MNVINKRRSSALCALRFGVLVLMLCAAMPSAWSKQHKPDPSNSNPPANHPLVLWDISKPDSPRVIQRFANVSRVLSDDRGYVYILNDDGLWVISAPAHYLQDQPNPFQTFWVCAEYANEAQEPCTQGY